jgi:sugar lactone lactonase YvrE
MSTATFIWVTGIGLDNKPSFLYYILTMKDSIENVPTWSNAGQVLKENDIRWDYVMVDQLIKRDWYTGLDKAGDGFFYHFMISGHQEVAIWSPVFKKISFFESPRKWDLQLALNCKVLAYNTTQSL